MDQLSKTACIVRFDRRFPDHAGPITSVGVSADGKRVISSSDLAQDLPFSLRGYF